MPPSFIHSTKMQSEKRPTLADQLDGDDGKLGALILSPNCSAQGVAFGGASDLDIEHDMLRRDSKKDST